MVRDIDAHGSYAGKGINSGYSVDHTSATVAVDSTESKLDPITSAGTAITNAILAAESALPPALSDAAARLATLRRDHVRDVTTIRTFADGCVSSIRGCLTAYENASAEQVAETVRAQKNIVFDTSGLFTNTTNDVNKALGANLPKRNEGWENSRSYEYTGARDGTSSTTETTRTRAGDGSRTVATDTRAFQQGGGTTTYEQTRSAAHTSNGVTDTTTYYNGTAYRGVYGPEATTSGRSYTVSGGTHSTTTTEGSMRVAVP